MHLREFLIFPTLLAGTAAAGQVGYIPAFCGSTSSPCPLSTAVVLNLSSNQVTGEISLGGAAPSAMAITPDGTRIYITSGQTVYVVERATHQIVATIPLPLQGIGIAIRPDGLRAYVSAENQSLKSPAVLVIQISSNKLVAGKPLPAFANGIAVTPDSKLVYMALANGSVSILDTATNQVSTIQTGSPLLEGIAITPDGARAYLSGYLSQTSTGVIVLSTATNTVLTTIPIGGQVFGIAVTPDGSKAYVITSVPTGSSPGGSAFVILTSTNQILTSVGVGVSPSWVTITQDGTRDLVTNSNASVSSIDAQSETLAATIRTPGPVGQIAISPDSQRAYTAARTDAVLLVDPTTDTVVSHIPIGFGPAGIAVSSDGARAYVASAGSSRISVVDTVSRKVVQWLPLPLSETPGAVAVTPDGSRLYVAVSSSLPAAGHVLVLDPGSGALITRVVVPSSSGNYGVREALVVSPDGSHVYVSVAEIPQGAGLLLPPSGFVMVFDTATSSLSGLIRGPGGGGIAVTPDGQNLYVGGGDYDIAIVSTTTNQVVSSIPLIVGNAFVFTPDGSRVYIPDNTGSLWVVSTPQNQVVTHFPLPGAGSGFYPSGAAISLDGSQVWITGTLTTVPVVNASTNALAGAIQTGGVTTGVVFAPQ